MSLLRTFFMPFTLFLGAVIFFLIFNPGVLFGIVASLVSLIFSNWIVGAIVVLVLIVLMTNES